LIKEVEQSIENANTQAEKLNKKDSAGNSLAERKKFKSLIEQFEVKRTMLDNVRNEAIRMKEGSVALISQITTISKIRIYDPEYATHCLAGIKLEPSTLSMIDEKIKELFIYEKI
jgi:nitrogen-specific signal transduction histidine kinase